MTRTLCDSCDKIRCVRRDMLDGPVAIRCAEFIEGILVVFCEEPV